METKNQKEQRGGWNCDVITAKQTFDDQFGCEFRLMLPTQD